MGVAAGVETTNEKKQTQQETKIIKKLTPLTIRLMRTYPIAYCWYADDE